MLSSRHRCRSPLTWFGGKAMLAKWICSYIPEHRTYVEVFGGAANVLFRKIPSDYEVYNDVFEDLVNFFRVLRDKELFGQFYDIVLLVPYSLTEYRDAYEKYSSMNWEDNVDRAVAFFIANRMALGGLVKRGGIKTWANNRRSCRHMPEQVSRWLAVIDDLPVFAERLLEVQIECSDFERILGKYDDADTVFYLDPPYLGENIPFNDVVFSEADHRRLLLTLLHVKGMCILSGYDSDMYFETLEEGAGWYYTSKVRRYYSKMVGYGEKLESLWISPNLAEKLISDGMVVCES